MTTGDGQGPIDLRQLKWTVALTVGVVCGLLVLIGLFIISLLYCVRRWRRTTVSVISLQHSVEDVAAEVTEHGSVYYLAAPGLFLGEDLRCRFVDYQFTNPTGNSLIVRVFALKYENFLFEVAPHSTLKLSEVFVHVQKLEAVFTRNVAFSYDDALSVSVLHLEIPTPVRDLVQLVHVVGDTKVSCDGFLDVIKISGLKISGMYVPLYELPGQKQMYVNNASRATVDGAGRIAFARVLSFQVLYLLIPGRGLPKFRFKK